MAGLMGWWLVGKSVPRGGGVEVYWRLGHRSALLHRPGQALGGRPNRDRSIGALLTTWGLRLAWGHHPGRALGWCQWPGCSCPGEAPAGSVRRSPFAALCAAEEVGRRKVWRCSKRYEGGRWWELAYQTTARRLSKKCDRPSRAPKSPARF